MELKRIKRKALLLGDGAVGKTSLIRKFVTDKFDDKYITTIGTKITKKEMAFKELNVELTLMMWDVLGQKGYTSIQSSSYRGAEGAIMVCDLTRAETLRSLEEYWMPELAKVVGDVPLVFVGNKVDLIEQRQVEEDELAAFAGRHSAPFYMSSARTGERVEDLFKKLGELVLADRMDVSVEGGDIKEIKTIVDATDFVIMDFCKSYADQETAMAIVRTQFAKAELDVKAPTRQGLLKAIDLLAEAEKGFKDEPAIFQNRMRRRQTVDHAGGH
ncbi:MAG: Rab family GTPase [Methanobacteriota archaeon]